MKRYRIKKTDGHILGPLSFNELAEFFRNDEAHTGYIYQVFPIGDWAPYNHFSEFEQISLEQTKTTTVQEQLTQTTNQSQIIKENSENTEFREFKFKREDQPLVDYEALEKKHNEGKKNKIAAQPEKNVDKTVVLRKPVLKDLEKTRVLNRSDVAFDDEESEKEEEVLAVAPIETVVPEEKIDTNNKTMIMNLSSLLPKKEDDINEIEQKILELEEKAKATSTKGNKKSKHSVDEDGEDNEGKKKKRNLSIVLFLIFALVYLWPTKEDEKPKKLIRPVIGFPIAEKNSNEELAVKYFQEGLVAQKKDSYVETIKASLLFAKSMSNKFRSNEALAPLILTYSELLPESENKFESGKIINQLITISGQLVLKNADVALGAANYYSYFEKEFAAISILESYLRINKPTVKLYAKYLNLLIDVGDFVKAKIAFEKLIAAPSNDIDVIHALGRYYVANEQVEKALTLYEDKREMFQKNLKFLVNYGDLLLKSNNIERLKPLTVILLAEYGGGSPFILAQAYKFMGYIKIANKEYKEVTKFFNGSLELYDSIELKEALATLDVGGDKLTEELIGKSKVAVLIGKAKIEASNLNWQKAFQYAIQASDVMENNLTAKLYLSDLQIKRGYFNSAISTLNKLREKYPINIKVNYNLVMANLKAYKVEEVRRLITIFSTVPELQNSYEYLALLGYYYAASGNSKLAFERFQGALSKNPLRDDYYFEMAKIAFSVKKLKKAREYLSEAIKLDPFNYDYKILYSKVLFELDDVQTAIGYLRSELEKTPDNPKLIGQIGIFYFQDQNISEYKIYREKLLRLSKSDESLFDYMVTVSELEGDFKGLIDNSERLLLISPGKLDVRMKQANAYFQAKRYKEALASLSQIEERLDTYPKVHYNKARVYLAIEEYRNAESSAKKEIEANPGSEFGYYILGEIYLKLEMFNDAKKSLEKSLQIKPDFYECLLAMGWLKLKQGQAAAARELYLRALRNHENEPEIRKRLGYVYKEIGQSVMAIEQFKIYLQLNPAASDREVINRIILQLQ